MCGFKCPCCSLVDEIFPLNILEIREYCKSASIPILASIPMIKDSSNLFDYDYLNNLVDSL